MKVRLQDGELRLRLLPRELDRLTEGGTVEERVRLAEGAAGNVVFAVQGVRDAAGEDPPDPLDLDWSEGRALVRVRLERLEPLRRQEDVELSAVLSYDGTETTVVLERDLKPGRSRRPPRTRG